MSIKQLQIDKAFFIKILGIFVIWRVATFFISFISIYIIKDFGGRFPYVHELIKTNLPYWVWAYGNFDGVHYLHIAASGYTAQFTQAFFPLYPLLIRVFSFGDNYFLSGFLLSNVLLIVGLLITYALFRLDYDKETAFRSILFLISFPTAFYFGSIYTESLFLVLAVASIYLARKKQFLLAGIFAGVASGTRILGIFLFPLLLIEIFLYLKDSNFRISRTECLKIIIGLSFSVSGLILYMTYLHIFFNNALYFLSAQPAFGAARTDKPFILFPQVVYRYIKILVSVPMQSLAFMNAFLEVLFSLVPLISIAFIFKKLRLSYLVFTLGILILPTLTGTFSSMPRYALMSFLVLPLIMLKIKRYYWYAILGFVILQSILLALFTRGYWVA